MKYGIFCAVQAESAPIKARMHITNTHFLGGREIVEGIFGNQQIVLITGGVGKVAAGAAAQILIDRFGIDMLLAAGTAGAMDEELSICDLVLAQTVAYHDVVPGLLKQFCPVLPEVDYLTDPAFTDLAEKTAAQMGMPLKKGRFVTGDAFIAQEGRDEILQKFNPLCTDMETAALAQVAAIYALPFAALRAVSDTPRKSGLATFEENCAAAAKICAQALEKILAKC